MEFLKQFTKSESVVEKLRAIRLRKQHQKPHIDPSDDPLYNSAEAPELFKNHKLAGVIQELCCKGDLTSKKQNCVPDPENGDFGKVKKGGGSQSEKVARMIREIEKTLAETGSFSGGVFVMDKEFNEDSATSNTTKTGKNDNRSSTFFFYFRLFRALKTTRGKNDRVCNIVARICSNSYAAAENYRDSTKRAREILKCNKDAYNWDNSKIWS